MWERPPYAVCSAMRILPTCTSPSSCRNWPPQARVVMRLFNTSLTGPVRGMLGDVAVLSSTELTVPAFVAAIFGRRTAAVLPVGAEVLQIVDLTVERKTEVRTLEETCQARVMTADDVAFLVLDLEIVPGKEMRVVGTSRGLVELATAS